MQTDPKKSFLEVAKQTQAKFIQNLVFESPSLKEKIQSKTEKLYRKGELSRQQLWFGSYFRKEIETLWIPDVEIRYIDATLGWGVFAGRDFQKMEFIAEYSGVLRKNKWKDRTNAYCFEYMLAAGARTPYTIDALNQGGVSRYLNHSSAPNLMSSLATFDFVSHIVFITAKPIAKGEQLCYDYGSTYWSKREKPQEI